MAYQCADRHGKTMFPGKQSGLIWYGVPLLAAALTLAVDRPYQPGFISEFTSLFAALVLLTAWQGGRGPGLLAALTTGLALVHLLLTSRSSAPLGFFMGALVIGGYAVAAGLAVGVTEAL